MAVASVAVYAPTWSYGTLSYDDPTYVIENVHVTSGLSGQNVVWSFTSIYDANWIPLTWISLMLDVDLYGGRPAGFHVTNTLLHAACAVLLFLALAQATGSDLRSAFVAALFALHPLHVESVAWIAERKDVLSIFFGLLSLWAYVRAATSGGRLNLVLSFFCLALSLMAKQTLVTLPFVFLLLDFWPLRRWRLAPGPLLGADALLLPSQPTSIGRLVLEKLPFLGLSAAFCVVAASVQGRGGAIQQVFPLSVRCMNAVVVYAMYLQKTLIPIDLAVYYPHPGFALSLPLGVARVVVSGLVLLVVSMVAVLFLRRLPYLFVGWCWYLGTLVPMIGFVQIGTQQMADRYTYFPLIGIFLAVTWLIADGTPAGVWRTRVLPGAAVVLVIALGITSFQQIGYWRDTITLFSHALVLSPDHPNSHEHLGGAYLYAGMPEKAIPELQTALRTGPSYGLLQYELANALDKAGRGNEAFAHYQAALALDDKSAKPHNDFGVLLMSRHQDAEARRHLERAIELDPTLANAHANLSLLCAKTRDYPRAIAEGDRALALDPKLIDCHHYIAVALRGEGRYDEAIKRLERLLQLAPDYQVARKELEVTRIMQQRQRH